jgi:hypothetical protein
VAAVPYKKVRAAPRITASPHGVIFTPANRRKTFFRQKYFRVPDALSDIACAERRGRRGNFRRAL